ncbi:hypothetical protein FEK30_04950 [Picosynechococcus sp. PCC 11901]|uniref:hypothetical protein n=1 Tax=Picosynechococcus sp. PCC 11901 TaxID=2579791 RepID=UPI0010FBFF53|nr:hypothetical protein [Picosynechococcus sp. PCC 11901]QCS48837.1 hypothetical protein FEK30_04950 [Picosynechococcus sp. PCC 11901]
MECQQMNPLLETIDHVFSSGTLTKQDARVINQWLWKTPMSDALYQALDRLLQGIEAGYIAVRGT